MSNDPDRGARGREPDYRVYRSGSGSDRPRARLAGKAATAAGRDGDGDQRPRKPLGRSGTERPYVTYRSLPRGLIARLRGESDSELLARELAEWSAASEPGGRRGRRGRRGRGRREGTWWQTWSWRRGLKYGVLTIVGWVVLSVVLFFISAQENSGNLPAGATSELSSAGPMLTSPNTVLIIGLDNRPTAGFGSKEPGSNHSEALAATDTIMLWRIGGGVSRRLSIPRDTAVEIPGIGYSKINAAWAAGGPALALKVIKQFAGVQINHLIVVDLGNFPKFIDDIGGVTVNTPRICSQISGGTANGGFTLNLHPGSHHLGGVQAMVLARTRHNSCNPAYNDLNREAMQQQILNGIKSQLFSVHAFLLLPWAAWDAPGVIQTDMGGLSLLQLFIAAEIGGSAPPALLKESSQVDPGLGDILVPNQANVRQSVAKLMNG
jgi:LCP family protein required for cell wall assembly